MAKAHVWFENGKLCAVMPALILFSDVFEPMWRMKSASVIDGSEYTYVCINPPKSGHAIVRTGRGFGRHGREKYYFVDFGSRTAKKLVHKPTKKLHGGWMVCVHLPDESRLCFEWRNGRLCTASLPF